MYVYVSICIYVYIYKCVHVYLLNNLNCLILVTCVTEDMLF